ncbi:ArsR/SmtB family transcription factor [Chitinophaga lutea]
MNKRVFKDKIYGELARVTKALGNPHRLEIVDLLAQGPFSVEQIANATGMSVANASQHLQTLKHARLVHVSREGNFILYSLAGNNVYQAWAAIRELGMAYNADADRLLQDYRKNLPALDPVDADGLLAMLEKNNVLVLDVRTEEEYNRSHIHRAISVPLEQLSGRLKKLPKSKMIVAYCRGPFCVYADEAVALLTEKGYRARRMTDGFPDWVSKGYPVESH